MPPPAFDSAEPYPANPDGRTRWIVGRRSSRVAVDPWRPHAYLIELERLASGEVVRTPTVFLTNRECPWHCLMCDLWKTTLTEPVPVGAIPAQIDFAFRELGLDQDAVTAERMQLKLYNGGSFFDPKAIPPSDYGAIAQRAAGFSNVVVEAHPGFVNASCLRFRDLLAAQGRCASGTTLEVAMGLETAHREVLEKLNKRMTLEQFSRAAAFLRENGIGVRAFVLIKPPFLHEAEALLWAERSIAFAFEVGVQVVALIPTRAGNGALESLQARAEFSPPQLATIESAQQWGIGLRAGRVFADLWNLELFSSCPECFEARKERMRRMNLEQIILPEVQCSRCSQQRRGPGGERP